MPRERLEALDAFRGFASVCVVAYHITLRYPAFMVGEPTPATPLFPGFLRIEAGIVPVLWFFLISGFVITWTVDRCRTPMDFIVSRMSRIYPAYWASLLLTVLAIALWPLPGIEPSMRDILVNVTMLQAYLLVPDVAGVYWSLAVELMFYLFALALFAAGLWRHVHVVAFTWACLGLVLAVSEQAGFPGSWRVNQLLLLHYAPLLAAGTMLYQLWRRHHLAWSGVTLAICIAAIATTFSPVSTTTCLVAMALIAWSAHGGLRWLAAPPLLWLGSVSYSLYLVHEYPSYIVMRALDARGTPHSVAMAAAGTVSLALAAAVSYGVERPAMRLIRAAWRRTRPTLAGITVETPVA